MITLSVWGITQTIKVVIGILTERRFNFKWFIGTGGMPSSHTAGVSALATACGLDQGFDSPVFAIAAAFAIVTMFDAQGVRRATGQQAVLLNNIVDDMHDGREVHPERLKELIGHTPLQVIIGSFLGIFLGYFFYYQ